MVSSIPNTNNLQTVIVFQVFLSNKNNLHTVIWFQVFQSNTNRFLSVLGFQVFLSNTNNFHRVLQFQVPISVPNNFVWFLSLIEYQPSFGIKCQISICRRILVEQFYIVEEIRGLLLFQRMINPKVNMIARLECELDYYDIAVPYVSRYTTGSTIVNNWQKCYIV